MSDGISDGRRRRSLDDILAAGAAWITECELQDLGEELKAFRADRMFTAFRINDEVFKPEGYAFFGEVRGIVQTLDGSIRYVVECTTPECAGLLHIFSAEDLCLRRSTPSQQSSQPASTLPFSAQSLEELPDIGPTSDD